MSVTLPFEPNHDYETVEFSVVLVSPTSQYEALTGPLPHHEAIAALEGWKKSQYIKNRPKSILKLRSRRVVHFVEDWKDENN